MAWALNLEPEADDEVPSRVEFEGLLYRRRRQHPWSVATLFITLAHVLIIIDVSFRIIKLRLPVATSLACLLLVFFLPMVNVIAYQRKKSHSGLRQLYVSSCTLILRLTVARFSLSCEVAASEMGEVVQIISIAEELKSEFDAVAPFCNKLVQLAEDIVFDCIHSKTYARVR
jgi:hypothetical protein